MTGHQSGSGVETGGVTLTDQGRSRRAEGPTGKRGRRHWRVLSRSHVTCVAHRGRRCRQLTCSCSTSPCPAGSGYVPGFRGRRPGPIPTLTRTGSQTQGPDTRVSPSRSHKWDPTGLVKDPSAVSTRATSRPSFTGRRKPGSRTGTRVRSGPKDQMSETAN